VRGDPAWRLLVDPPAAGAVQMARDEALLARAAGPVLRLYAWDPPCLSLGRVQPAQGAHDPDALAQLGFDLVRRPTGGRAVLHASERTYAVIGRLGVDPFPGGVLDTYRRIARALQDGLRRLGLPAEAREPAGGAASPAGVPVCFDRAGDYEIAVGERKVVGSAQLRRRQGFLQHGSILRRAHPDLYAAAVGAPVDPGRLAGVDDLLGRTVPLEELDAALVAGFETAFEARLVPSCLTASERAEEARLLAVHRSAAWVREGRRPAATPA